MGEGSEASNYLAAKFLHQEDQKPVGEDLFKMDESAFLEQLSSFEKEGLTFLDNNLADLGDTFLNMERVNISFEQKSKILSYEPAHAYYAKIEDFKASDIISDAINSVDINQPQNLSSPNYGSFITSFISNKAYKMSSEDEKYSKLGTNGVIKASMDLISSSISQKAIQKYALDQVIKQTLRYSSALGMEPMLPEIKTLTDNPKTFDIIDKSLEKWGHLAKGKPAPNFDGMTVNGKQIQLSDLKGKNVYIDVWATWCGPCIGEQPALFELEEKYKHNKNLAFMGVSIDSDKEAWMKMVTEKDMKGEQIFTEGAWKSTICKEYLINGIPRFILVGKDGNIIDANAPRPSSDNIKDILRDLSGEPLLSSL